MANFVDILTVSVKIALESLVHPTKKSFVKPFYISDVKGRIAKAALQKVIISPVFKLIFCTVCSFTLISLVIVLCLSFQHSLNQQQTSIFESCLNTWKAGTVAIAALLVGKATDITLNNSPED